MSLKYIVFNICLCIVMEVLGVNVSGVEVTNGAPLPPVSIIAAVTHKDYELEFDK